MATKKKPAAKPAPDHSALATRHLTKALKHIAACEMDEDPAQFRSAVVEATMVQEEVLRTMLLGQLALTKLDMLEELPDGDDDEDEDDEDEDDE